MPRVKTLITMGFISTILNLFGCSGQEKKDNGGYNHFYFNSSGKFYKHLPEALKFVGANKFADLTKQVNDTFLRENAKITQHQDGTLAGFRESYDDNPLNEFDNQFYDLYKTEDLQQIQVNFIRKNKTEFID